MKNVIWAGQKLFFLPRKSLSEPNTQHSSTSHFSVSLPSLKDFCLIFSQVLSASMALVLESLSHWMPISFFFFFFFFINLENLPFNFRFFNSYFFHVSNLFLNWKTSVSSTFSQRLYCLVIVITLAGLFAIALSHLCPILDKMPLHHSREYIYKSFWKCFCLSFPLYIFGGFGNIMPVLTSAQFIMPCSHINFFL